VDGEEAVRGIGLAVRDPRWATIPPRFTEYRVTRHPDRFSVRLAAEHVADEIDFAWCGGIEGYRDGTIRFAVDGIARRSFLRARIGLCVLHSGALAGRPIRAATPWGTIRARIPREIAPVAPVSMVRSLSQRLASGGSLELAFTGDLFEMEDQRNFGDASFKTYSTPLCIPYPVWVEEGTRVTQSVTLFARPAAGTTRRRPASRPAPAILTVGATAHPMPALGLGVSDHRTVIADRAADRLRDLHLGHARVTVDTTSNEAPEALSDGLRQARLAGAPVELALLTDRAGSGVEDAIARCRAEGATLTRVLVFDRATSMTTRAAARCTREALRAHGDPTPVCGGSAAWFDLINMNGLPVDALDGVAFGMCPQVHAADDATVMENVATLRDQVATGAARWPGRPLVIGPVGIAYPFNPWSAEPELPGIDGLPYGYDHRHPTLFGAAWVLGALANAAWPGVAAITLRELAGWSGVVAAAQPWLPDLVVGDGTTLDDGSVVPAYHVLADVLELGREVRRLRSDSPPGIACLALASGRRRRVLIANLSPAGRRIRVRIATTRAVRVRVLDEETSGAAMCQPATFRADPGTEHNIREWVTLDLSPYAIARIDAGLQEH
jgi:hypothetical protein